MKKRLVVLYDGTWNNRKDNTNVWRLKERIAALAKIEAAAKVAFLNRLTSVFKPAAAAKDPWRSKELVAPEDEFGVRQLAFYDEGVGTHWYDWFTGGAFGRGLSLNIRQGYKWLTEKYREGDEIYLFGFSRGAYTARSLAGFIRKCGLLRTASEDLIHQAYGLYRDKSIAPKDDRAAAFRASFSREVRIKFIGVWDTVGALGIPITGIPFGRDKYLWHDTELSKIVDYAYHAIAVDEHRADFDVSVWARVAKPENLEVEQRWFIGAHANVGGGYRGDKLPNIPLKWICDKARLRGLAFSGDIQVGPNDFKGTVQDSYGGFMFKLYHLFKRPHFRVFGQGLNETVDDSVWQRWDEDKEYKPPTLSGERERGRYLGL